jgi:hypothetical protein
MDDVNNLIRIKLEEKSSDKGVFELAMQALKFSSKDSSETSVAEQLEAVVRKLVKKRDTQR